MQKRLVFGAICSEIFFERTGEVVKGMMEQAFACNCDIVFLSALYSHMHEWNEHRSNERDLFRLILSERFDGFLFDRRFFYNDEMCSFVENLLIRSKKPVMMVDDCEHRLFDNTASDDSRPYEKLVDHLVDVHGCRRIFCLTGPENSVPAQERLRGYFNSMKKHGLEYDRSLYRYGDFWKQSAITLADDIIEKRIPRPDAVACGNDITAETLIEHLSMGGINVPEDIAVVGFDSMDGYKFAEANITSYKRANFQLGADSVRRLYRMITGSVAPRANYDIEELVIGSSCGCCKLRTPDHKEKRIRDHIRNFDREFFDRDICMECIAQSDIESALKKACEYAFYIYRSSTFTICLTADRFTHENSHNSLTADSTVKRIIKRRSSGKVTIDKVDFSASGIIPELSQPHSKPMALFVNILNSINNEFGYTVLSFGKNICTFSEGYKRYIYEIVNVLEHFRSISIYTRQVGYRTDPFTELPVLSVYEEKFAEMESPSAITIEIMDMRKFYLGMTLEKFVITMKRLTVFLRGLLREGEFLAYVSHGVYAFVTADIKRADDIYSAFCNNDTAELFGQDVQFIVGSYLCESGKSHNIYEAARSAMMNIRHTVSNKSRSKNNPLFEKLCAIRERMAASPQYDWNIDEISTELNVSKSYLQKYYKNHFGISIIENIIRLRLDMAKHLLSETDMSITQIAEKCGYSSYIHFTKQFRKYEGTTPTEFRKNEKNVGTRAVLI